MDVPEVQRLFRYDLWANQEVARVLTLASPPRRSVKRIANILAAEAMWLDRLQGRRGAVQAWPEHGHTEIWSQVWEIGDACRVFVNSLDDAALNENRQYTNTRGEPFVNTVSDILTHVVMHSVYHRGQIAADLRLAGFEPPATDFIHAVRNGYVDNTESRSA